MPRFILEELMTADFLKNLVDNPRDRAQELQPMMQVAGLTLEERYFVVGENKLIDIVRGDSDAVQAFSMAALSSGVPVSFTVRQITTSAETVPILQRAKESSFSPPSGS